jgi:hypothetical protein
MSFEMKKLVGCRVLVTGTDVAGQSGSTVLNSSQWDEFKADKKYDQAAEAFDTAVEEFFAPLVEAADKAKAALVAVPEDPMSYVVLSEKVDGVEGSERTLIYLEKDSIVLRLLEQGDTDRLVWVGDNLEILEAVPAPVVSDEY